MSDLAASGSVVTITKQYRSVLDITAQDVMPSMSSERTFGSITGWTAGYSFRTTTLPIHLLEE